jgi:hypothetical protein
MIFSKVDGSASSLQSLSLINGIVVAYLNHLITDDIGNRFIFAVLASSASYIAVPAAMKIAVQKQILEFSCLWH